MPSGEPHRDLWAVATVELARARLAAGQVTQARADAATVVDEFDKARLTRHRVARDAEEVAAEADLAIAFGDVNWTDDRWRHAADRVGALADESVEWFGVDNPHTLRLRVMHGLALIHARQGQAALEVLTSVEPAVAGVLGADHPVALHTRSLLGSARFAAGQADRTVAVLAAVLPRQEELLGAAHPQVIETRFALGLAHAGVGDRPKAFTLVSEAWKAEGETHGWVQDRTLDMMVHQLVVLSPSRCMNC